ncbi:MAG: hypothetical protein C0621_01225 [Desulfuromonas sp.]|nr:MAG: hypothetical protein C0621_01225 [Desulfuromonas sp.]
MKKQFSRLFAAALLLCAAPFSSALASDDADLLTRVEKLEAASAIHVGGAVRVNYGLTDWSESSKDKSGDFAFDLFRLNVDGTQGDITLSAEYRFYPEYNFNALHHAYLAYDFSETLQGQVGVHQVPFGIQPYASHNFWFSGAYYVGLEDDYDMGIKLLYDAKPWHATLAFYKNGELGAPSVANRYSVDVNSAATGGFAGAQAAGNEETNQVNGRLAYTLDHGDLGSTELGVSLEAGKLYNSNTAKNEDRVAGALHLVGDYGPFNVQLEYASYSYNVANPPGFDDQVVTVGAYGSSWGIPTEADIATFNVAYTRPVTWGPIESVTLYSDNTVITPKEGRFDNVSQNVVGALFAAGPVYTYVDIISGEDMIFMGGDMVGATDASSGRNTRLNVNIGYYF